ncbi:hypothetical protein BD779DRAFT_996417 [Infundibulicybe gibba]|nr:hypothetical protein BD779DRAFT_996417 [Infundibulicybe gibba]
MVAELPYEIWTQIAQYLPITTVRNLLALNRTLSAIATTLCWQEPLIPSDSRGRIVAVLNRLENKSDARRVHKLCLNLDEIEAMIPRENSSLTLRRRILHRSTIVLSKLVGFRIRPCLRQDTADTIVRVIENDMPAVTELWVCLGGLERTEFADSSRIASSALHAFHCNLKSLTLDVSFNTIWNTLPCVIFQCLEDLKIKISIPAELRPETISPFFSLVLVGFISAHRNTLQSLSVLPSFQLPGQPCVSLLSLLACLPRTRMDRLRRLETFDYEEAGISELLSFLRAHSKIIEDFSLRVYPTLGPRRLRGFYRQRILHVPLPCLERLGIYTDGFNLDWRKFATYIGRFKSTLRELAFTGTGIDYSDLVTVLRGVTGHQSLRTLRLPIETLSAQHIELISKSLPQLTELRIDFANFEIEPTDRVKPYRKVSVPPTLLPPKTYNILVLHGCA